MKAPSEATANQRKEHNVEKVHSVTYNAFADDMSIFIRFAAVASQICEFARNSLKIRTYRVQGHPRSSILVSIESAYATSY